MIKRLRIEITGRVQGVGFRPAAYRHALACRVSGFVKNTVSGVVIEAEAEESRLQAFIGLLKERPSLLSKIESFSVAESACAGAEGFSIVPSAGSDDPITGMPPDIGLCEDCRRELLDKGDRRYGYPFINCVNCGPRFTIIRELPYDRERTSMAAFAMCPQCRKEYADPADRRFDAQPDACPVCGPCVRLLNSSAPDPVREAGALLRRGAIVAVKGLGGYHLACHALNQEAVRKLRERKRRPSKSFAVMFASLQELETYCAPDEAEKNELVSPARPVVILERHHLPEQVSPDTNDVGAFLPYTPLHELLLRECSPLVMTSGNRAEEPIAKDERGLGALLGSIADDALVHNRDIVRRCDDSVLSVVRGKRLFVRRSRGFVPDAISLPHDGPPVLALGADLKNVFCVAREKRAFLSQHVGDLSEYPAYSFYRESISDMLALLKCDPAVIVHDMHPDYRSSRFSSEFSNRTVMAVQHHHAHVASCMAEHGLTGPVIGVALDGTGFGPDGTIWGGEFLVTRLDRFRRAGHFKPYPLPGGEAGILHPLRFALSICISELGESAEALYGTIFSRLNEMKVISRMAKTGSRSPMTSSCGRLFDAVSAMLGLCTDISYEAQAAIKLQHAAMKGVESRYSYEISHSSIPLILSFKPMIIEIIRDIEKGISPRMVSAMFHNTIAHAVTEMCLHIGNMEKLSTVALSGGVFQNRLLLDRLAEKLEQSGFSVYWNNRVSPNDSGIALGQAAIARARIHESRENTCVSQCPEKSPN